MGANPRNGDKEFTALKGPDSFDWVMSTYTQIYYHIVFSTKERVPALTADKREDLFRYIWGILKNKESHLYRINGVEDHVHILTSVHPTVCLADLVREIKTSTNKWIKENRVFPKFTNWQDGYAAFTVSHDDRDVVIEYIKNQEEHHKKISFRDELRGFWKNTEFNSMKNILIKRFDELSGPFGAEINSSRFPWVCTHGYSRCSPSVKSACQRWPWLMDAACQSQSCKGI